jgi:hypothetical protein
VYWREQPKQLSLVTERRRVCPVCRTFDPPTEPAYGCPECGEGATLSELGDSVPELCPWCGDGKPEVVTENACAECRQGEVEPLTASDQGCNMAALVDMGNLGDILEWGRKRLSPSLSPVATMGGNLNLAKDTMSPTSICN